MSAPAWHLPAPAPAREEVFDQVHVASLTLRFPVGTPVGGEVVVARTFGTKAIDERVVILEPGEADPILESVLGWLLAVLEKRKLLAPGAVPAPAPAPPPAPAPLGTLG